jgi:hypothetical protein
MDVAIPATGSAVSTEVRDITVPSPGQDRDYIIFVGYDVGKWDLMNGTVEVPVVAAVQPPPPPVDEPPQPPPAPKTPSVLPVPNDGFVLQ